MPGNDRSNDTEHQFVVVENMNGTQTLFKQITFQFVRC